MIFFHFTPYKDACSQKQTTRSGIHADYHPPTELAQKPQPVCSRHDAYPRGECSGANPAHHHRSSDRRLRDADLRCGVRGAGGSQSRLQRNVLPVLGIDVANKFFYYCFGIEMEIEFSKCTSFNALSLSSLGFVINKLFISCIYESGISLNLSFNLLISSLILDCL